MNLAQSLLRVAQADPRRPALFEGTRLLRDYGGLADRVARLASAFHAAGLKPGDRVALFMHNHPAYLEVMYGAWWAGLAVVPESDRHWLPSQLTSVLKRRPARSLVRSKLLRASRT